MSASSRKSDPNAAGPEAIPLASVVGALLRDLGAAQGTADADAARRAADGGSAPAAQLVEAEIDLHFAIDETARRAIEATPVRLTPGALRPATIAFAQAVIRTAAEELRRQPDSGTVVDNLTSPAFEEHLSAAAAAALRFETATDAVIAALRAVVDRELLDDRSVARFFPPGTEARAALHDAVAADAHRAADRIARLARGAQAAAGDADVRVIVASERLARVAPELLAHIRLKARVDSDRWVADMGGS